MSFLFATEAELGYDPKVILDENKLQYTYEIPKSDVDGSRVCPIHLRSPMVMNTCHPRPMKRMSDRIRLRSVKADLKRRKRSLPNTNELL